MAVHLVEERAAHRDLVIAGQVQRGASVAAHLVPYVRMLPRRTDADGLRER